MMGWSPEEQREHRKLWVEALRSGKYEQARGRLRRDGNYCCLGVACEVSGLGEWDGNGLYHVNGAINSISLPNTVRLWLGLASSEGSYVDGSNIDHVLTYLNDRTMTTFAELADIIESEPEGLIAKPEAA